MAQPLVKKLLIKPGYHVAVLNSPVGYHQLLGDSPEGMTLSEKLDGTFDFIHLFVRTSAGVAAIRAQGGAIEFDTK